MFQPINIMLKVRENKTARSHFQNYFSKFTFISMEVWIFQCFPSLLHNNNNNNNNTNSVRREEKSIIMSYIM